MSLKDAIRNIEKVKNQYIDIDHNRRKVFHESTPRLWSSFSIVASQSQSKNIKELKKQGGYRNIYNLGKHLRCRSQPRRKTNVLLLDTFYMKDEAYRYSDTYSRLPIFSIDKSDETAKKWYVVCGYDEWWKNYSKCRPDYRYAYEVVLPELECHLYVDAEVDLNVNDKSLEEYNTLFKELLEEMKFFMRKWHIAPKDNLDKTRIVILDSSKPVKFSKHLIIKIPECMFKNNYYCGAFIRQFHLYILKKYGPSEKNKFYVFSERKNDDTPSFKQFIIDLGVYTKGRDFRLLGSRKRVSTSKRWLWIEGKPDQLTRKDFFDSLIQYQPPNKELKYIICNVPDLLNGGIPMSSSLRTLSPKGASVGEQCIMANINNDGVITSYNPGVSLDLIEDALLSSKRSKMNPPPKDLIERLCNYFTNNFNITILKVSMMNGIMIFNTNCKKCLIKRHITKDEYAVHTNNVIFFIVNARDGCLKQSCFNTTYCVEQRSQRHRKFKMGYIKDKRILDLLCEWCKDNHWDFRYPEEAIPDRCILESDSE